MFSLGPGGNFLSQLVVSRKSRMLNKSFVHLPGIGLSTERKLWDRGVQSWQHLNQYAPSFFEGPRLQTILQALNETQTAWETRDLAFFYRAMPRPELWRLVPQFFDDIAYLDIETNGLKLPPCSQSTTITFYFRGQLYQEHEHHLKELLCKKIDAEATIYCSFFGEVFDIPFLRKEFNVPFNKAHLDLCFWLKRLGFQGGLKKVEKMFDDVRKRGSMDIDGLDAVRLWALHKKGVPGALETLLTYNAEDTLVLEALLVKAFNLEVDKRPYLGLEKLEARATPPLKTAIDPKIYDRLRSTPSFSY